MTAAQPTDWERGNRAATTLVLRSRVKRADVLAFAARPDLSTEYIDGATSAFHKQGPALWRFWCAAMDARKRAGLPVPPPFAAG